MTRTSRRTITSTSGNPPFVLGQVLFFDGLSGLDVDGLRCEHFSLGEHLPVNGGLALDDLTGSEVAVVLRLILCATSPKTPSDRHPSHCHPSKSSGRPQHGCEVSSWRSLRSAKLPKRNRLK